MVYALFTGYGHLLTTYPLQTRCVTSGVLFSARDYTVQNIEGQQLDYNRLKNYFIFGLWFAAPLLTIHYTKLLPRSGSIGKRLLIDQTIFAPFFWVYLNVIQGFIEKKPFSEIKEALSNEFVPFMKEYWKIWPILQLFNFAFLPLKYHILFINTVNVPYIGYYTWMMKDKNKQLEEMYL